MIKLVKTKIANVIFIIIYEHCCSSESTSIIEIKPNLSISELTLLFYLEDDFQFKKEESTAHVFLRTGRKLCLVFGSVGQTQCYRFT